MDDKLVKCKSIDGNLVFTRVILECASEEPVSEEELVNPVYMRDSFIKPGLEECKSHLEILDVTS